MGGNDELWNNKDKEKEKKKKKKSNKTLTVAIEEAAGTLINGDLSAKISAAKDVRSLVRRSKSAAAKTRSRLAAAGVIQPLVLLLLSPLQPDAKEASLLALLNLAVRHDPNKVSIVASGAIPPLIDLLKSDNGNLRELATAAILTLSTATSNKPAILSGGAASLLVQVLSSGSVQGKVDAVTALYNLSLDSENPTHILDATAVPSLIDLLKECKKYSKFAEKTTALLEIMSKTEDGRGAISETESGILTLVETVEDGSLLSTEHAVGVLLSLCQSCRSKYRDLILNEGAIPGLLRLTAEGTVEARERSRTLLNLLRESTSNKRLLSSSVLEKIVYNFATLVDGADKAAETAKKLLEDMESRLSTKEVVR